MKKALNQFLFAVIVGVLLLGCSLFIYYKSKYEHHFVAIRGFAPDAVLLQERIEMTQSGQVLAHSRFYQVKKPVWFFAQQLLKSNPQANLDAVQIKDDAKVGRNSWFVGMIPGPTPNDTIVGSFEGGKLRMGKTLKNTDMLGSGFTENSPVDFSTTTFLVTSDSQPDPLERLLAFLGFYR